MRSVCAPQLPTTTSVIASPRCTHKTQELMLYSLRRAVCGRVCRISFREGIASGDSHTMLPILRHLVQNPEQLKKRAFVGYYLSDVPLPDDVSNDEDVMQIREAIRALQQDFVRLHRACEQAKGAAKDPMKLRSRIPELENEKSQLKDKLEKTKAKLGVYPASIRCSSCRRICVESKRRRRSSHRAFNNSDNTSTLPKRGTRDSRRE